MDNVHILFYRNDEEAPEKMVNRLPRCPVCGAKAFLHGDTVQGFWFGWSVGCPNYRLNDGIHGHDDNTPRSKRLVRLGFATKEKAATWWRRRVRKELGNG